MSVSLQMKSSRVRSVRRGRQPINEQRNFVITWAAHMQTEQRRHLLLHLVRSGFSSDTPKRLKMLMAWNKASLHTCTVERLPQCSGVSFNVYSLRERNDVYIKSNLHTHIIFSADHLFVACADRFNN